jgi:hypothetical protein
MRTRFAIATVLAGLGLLAAAQPAAAEIIYEKADARIFDASRSIALGNGAVFQLTSTIYYGGMGGLCVIGGSVSETQTSGNGALIGPLAKGDAIGPSQVFTGGTADLETFYLLKGEPPCSGSRFHYSGPWEFGGYLGLSFEVNGETYYRWAQLVIQDGGQGGVTLFGYAYETIPGMPINAGQRKDAEDDAALSPHLKSEESSHRR